MKNTIQCEVVMAGCILLAGTSWVFGQGNGGIIAFDLAGGDEKWRWAVIGAGSCLMALPSSSELIVFKPSDKEYAEVARIKVSDAPVHATPVVAGNRMFVKDQDTVMMCAIPN